MCKNSRLRILVETEKFNLLKKMAEEKNLTLSEFCRRSLFPIKCNKTELMIEEIYNKIVLNNKNSRMTKFINSVADND